MLTALLLDTLFIGVQQHMERRDTVTSDVLMRVFIQTTEPVWSMAGKWLRKGDAMSHFSDIFFTKVCIIFVFFFLVSSYFSNFTCCLDG